MKKTYMKPSLLVVALQQRDGILQDVSKVDGGDTGIGSGDNGGNGSGLGADVKGSKNIWDEEW